MEGIDKIRAVRIEKLNGLRSAGVNPYPYRYKASHSVSQVIASEEQLSREETGVSVAGRIMALRGHGATMFGHLEDRTGKLQFYVRKDEVGEDLFAIFKLLEVGDILGVLGGVFRTKTGELTLRVKQFEVLAKALRPLPEKWHGLQDIELRYRQRYVDMIMNRDVREVFLKRSRIIENLRQFLIDRGYIEVETPILQPIYGGAAARPFTTHHNALDMDLYLRIADELYLKRLLVGGLERVFEFGKDFRNEGLDRSHNTEFTMLECYAAHQDYMAFMDMVEGMLRSVAADLLKGEKAVFKNHKIDFMRPWKRLRFFDVLKNHSGHDFRRMDDGEVIRVAADLVPKLDESISPARAIDEVFKAIVEPNLIDPTFVYDYPKTLSPLAKDHRSEEDLVERFEPFVAGFEIGNAFSELNDPLEQRRRFEQQAGLRAGGDEEAHLLDEDFLRALEYGMPPAAGLGLGIDRLTMVLTDSHSIRDVLFFPQMRRE
jgi:lysyl-tRNA synthetase class 2